MSDDIIPSLLTQGSSESNFSSYSTAGISPAALSLVLAFVNQVTNTVASGSNVPTCTGAGMTWVQVATQAYDSENPDRGRVTIFRALDASPGSGALTFDFGGETQARAAWGVVQFAGVDTGGADGADAIVQTVQGEKLPGDSDADLPAVTLATFEDIANATFGVIGVGFPDVTVTVGQGFLQQNNIAVGSNGSRTQSQFRPTNHVGVEWTLSAVGTESGFFGLELRSANPHTDVETNVITSGQNEADTTVYSTASISPAADRVLLAIVHGLRLSVAVNSAPTCAGLGLTWVEVATKSFSHGVGGPDRSRMSIFRAIGPGPTTGAVTFTFPETQARATHAVIELVGTETGGGDGADAIVQAAISAETTTSPSVTLAAGDPANGTFGGTCWSVGDPTVAPGTGFTELTENRLAPNGTGLQTQFQAAFDTTVDVVYGGLPITDFFTVAFGLEVANFIPTPPVEKVASDTLGLAIINEVKDLFLFEPIVAADTLGLAVGADANLQGEFVEGDLVTLGGFGEFAAPLAFFEIENSPPDAITLTEQVIRNFPQGPVSTAKTLMIAEVKLTSGTLFRAGKGIRHPTRMYVGKVKSFGSIIRSVQVPSGIAQIGDAELTITDADGELRRLMSVTPPQNREVVVKIGSEGQSESIFQIAYSGIITHATFPPGLAKIRLMDNTSQFLDEPLPDLLTRENFIADPVFAKNLRARTEGAFDESEIFSPIVFGVLDSTGLDVIGSLNAVRLDSTTFNLAQHPIPHAPIKIFIKDPDARPIADQEFVQLLGGFSIVEVAKTIEGIDYVFTHVVFGTGRATGYEVRWDGEGMTDDGTKDGVVIRNPAVAILQYLIRIAGRDPGTEIDLIGFAAQAIKLGLVNTGGPQAGYFCDGAITQKMNHREALARMTRSFGIFLFTNKAGRITIRYISGSDPDRPLLDDVQDIYVKSEVHSLARPIVNSVRLQYLRMFSEQSWQGLLTVDDDDSIDSLQRTEASELKLFFVRDDFVADRVARDFLQFTNPGSFRIVMTIPGHRRTADVELAQLIGVTNYSGLAPSGRGYEDKEFLIYKTEFGTDTKELRVHAVALEVPPALGLTESTSLEFFFPVVAADPLFENGKWFELTGRPPLDGGFDNPVVLPFIPKWITIEVANGFGGFPGVPVPTIGLLDFGRGIPGQVQVVLQGIAIITDQQGVDGRASRQYSFPYEGWRKEDRVFVRARDNQDGPAESAPQTHDWVTDITFWR